MTKPNIGPRLKAERARLKLTQETMAPLGGVSKDAQVNYERAIGHKKRRAPDADYLFNLHQSGLGLDLHYLITGERIAEASPGEVMMAVPNELKGLFDAWRSLWNSGAIDQQTIDLWMQLVHRMTPSKT